MQNKYMNLFTYANNTLKNGAIDLNFSRHRRQKLRYLLYSDCDAKKKKNYVDHHNELDLH